MRINLRSFGLKLSMEHRLNAEDTRNSLFGEFMERVLKRISTTVLIQNGWFCLWDENDPLRRKLLILKYDFRETFSHLTTEVV